MESNFWFIIGLVAFWDANFFRVGQIGGKSITNAFIGLNINDWIRKSLFTHNIWEGCVGGQIISKY